MTLNICPLPLDTDNSWCPNWVPARACGILQEPVGVSFPPVCIFSPKAVFPMTVYMHTGALQSPAHTRYRLWSYRAQCDVVCLNKDTIIKHESQPLFSFLHLWSKELKCFMSQWKPFVFFPLWSLKLKVLGDVGSLSQVSLQYWNYSGNEVVFNKSVSARDEVLFV